MRSQFPRDQKQPEVRSCGGIARGALTFAKIGPTLRQLARETAGRHYAAEKFSLPVPLSFHFAGSLPDLDRPPWAWSSRPGVFRAGAGFRMGNPAAGTTQCHLHA